MARRFTALLVVLVAVWPVCGQAPKKADPKGDKNSDKKKEAPKLSPELATLVEKLKAKTAKDRLAAVEAIAEKGVAAEDASTALCNAMMDRDAKVSLAALEALEKMNPELYKPLRDLCLDTQLANKAKALLTLKELSGKASPSTDLLYSRFAALVEMSFKSGTGSFPGGAAGKGSGMLLGENVDNNSEPLLLGIKYYDILYAFDPEEKRLDTLLHRVASEMNKSSNGRADAINRLHDIYNDDEARLKTLLPQLKAGLNNPNMIVFCIQKYGKLGAISKDMLKTLKNLKLSNDSAVREAADKAVKDIEDSK